MFPFIQIRQETARVQRQRRCNRIFSAVWRARYVLKGYIGCSTINGYQWLQDGVWSIGGRSYADAVTTMIFIFPPSGIAVWRENITGWSSSAPCLAWCTRESNVWGRLSAGRCYPWFGSAFAVYEISCFAHPKHDQYIYIKQTAPSKAICWILGHTNCSEIYGDMLQWLYAFPVLQITDCANLATMYIFSYFRDIVWG